MQSIDTIIAREGGFVDHPADRGGPTNMGVTIPALSHWLGRPATVDDIKGLTHDQATAVYQQLMTVAGLDGLEETLRAAVFDGIVNHGPSTAIKCLQRAVGTTPDGILGPATLDKARGQGKPLVFRFLRQRIGVYTNLVQKDSTQSVFLAGWLNRALDQIEPLVT